MEEPSHIVLRLGPFVLPRNNTERVRSITIEQTFQIPRTDAAGVVADKPLGPLKPVVLRHIRHSLLRHPHHEVLRTLQPAPTVGSAARAEDLRDQPPM